MKADVGTWVDIKRNGWAEGTEIFGLMNNLTRSLEDYIEGLIKEIEKLEDEVETFEINIEMKDNTIEEHEEYIEQLEELLDKNDIEY